MEYKKTALRVLLGFLMLVVLGNCSSQETATQTTVATSVPEIEIQPQASPTPNPFPLAERGPYYVGTIEITLSDANRNNRKVGVSLRYPALKQTDANGKVIYEGAAPDTSGAPYPLILTSPNSGSMIFRSQLASYGFVMATVEYPNLYELDAWDVQILDHPLDLLFVLNQLADEPPEGFEGVIDTDHVGVAGYSSDGDKTLFVSGARVDPENFLARCAEQLENHPPELDLQVGWLCPLANRWQAFSQHAGEGITSSTDGLWQPVTDERIRAVMPMAAAGAWIFGERGLAAVDRPTLIIAGTRDTITPYQVEPVYEYEHIGTPDKYLISFVGQGHLLVTNGKQVARINHFATAFFGYYLQGRTDYKAYFDENFVSRFDDLAWGAPAP
jgi:predicted dienelactone hydrolase